MSDADVEEKAERRTRTRKKGPSNIKRNAPGPFYPKGTPRDDNGVPREEVDVDREWADRNGYDAESANLNQTLRNLQTSIEEGDKVAFNVPDPTMKFLLLKRNPRLQNAQIKVVQQYPTQNMGIPSTWLAQHADFDSLINYVKQFWQGGDATYQWIVYDNQGAKSKGKLFLSGGKDEMTKPMYGPPPAGYGAPPGAAPAAPPPASPPQGGYQVPNGYCLVPIHQATAPAAPAPGPAPPPAPPMPQATSENPEILRLRYELALKEHEIKMMDWQRTQQQPAPAPAHQPQPAAQAPPPFDPQKYPGWYWDPATSTYKNALEATQAPPLGGAPPSPPLSPVEQAKQGIAVLDEFSGLADRLASRYAKRNEPPTPPPTAPPAEPEKVPLITQEFGPSRLAWDRASGERVSDWPTTLLINADKIENGLDRGYKKIAELFDKRTEDAKAIAEATAKSAAAKAESAKTVAEVEERLAKARAAEAEAQERIARAREMEAEAAHKLVEAHAFARQAQASAMTGENGAREVVLEIGPDENPEPEAAPEESPATPN